jgi:putative ABC transport system permease protein
MVLGSPFTVVGVVDKWMPLPRFYSLAGGSRYGTAEEFFIPFSTAIRHETEHNGSMSCNERRDPGFANLLTSSCTWTSVWFETRTAADRAELQNWLDSYTQEQRKLGRFKRNAPNKVFDVMEWLEYNKVVGNDSRLQVWLAFGFLALCLINTIGLLLAKFSVRAAEVGIRRALGASRREIFQQFLTETAVVGLAGGVLGLLLSFGALALIGMQSKSMSAVAHMDWMMLGFTFLLAVAASMLAGLLPTWRACQVTPAIQLKSQ